MVKEAQIPESKYPIFISNKPCGEDKFEGDSQNRLAESIANHFKRNDALPKENALPRIIGIEGGWGCGKSNVVKILNKDHIRDKGYVLFEYDAWGHQEDLQRRSFLELLTEELIDKKILVGKSRSFVSNKPISWGDKLKELLAKRVVRINKSLPQFNAGAFWTALFLALTPITVFLSEKLSELECIKSIPLLLLIAFAPIVLGLIVWGVVCICDKDARNFGYLLKISKTEDVETKNFETINEDEPTAIKFRRWMQDVSDSIGQQNKKQKLVVVFDNMDRLPADKVKELWSSIHTFFAEDGFENVWAIIPFDQGHLACAFGDCKDDNAKKEVEKLTSYFIAKTFPIVYRVPAPVITDYKGVFNKLFLEAFGDTQNDDKDLINRIYRLQNTEPNVRSIIVFINQLVALRLQWQEQISLINITLFALYKEDILKNSVERILSGDYLSEKIKKVILNDEERQAQMSALTYGVEIEVARQIPLTKYIQRCINSEPEHDINKYADLNSFDLILEEVVAELDETQLDQAVQCLKDLDRDSKTVSKLWNEIVDRRIKQPLRKPEFEDVYKTLLLKTDSAHQQKIVSHIVGGITAFTEFNGGDYYSALNALEVFLKENSINEQLIVPDKEVSPQVFIDYVFAANDNYTLYKLKADPHSLDDFFVDMMPDKLTITAVIPVLHNSTEYSFDNFLKRIEKAIDEDEVKEANFELIMFCYKNLSPSKPLDKQLKTTTVSNLLSLFESKQQEGLYPSGYYDTIAMSLAAGANIGGSGSDAVSQVAQLMDYYANYGDLLIDCTSLNNPMLNKVLKYMTVNRLGNSLSIEMILPIYEQIKATIDVTDEELLTQLADLSESTLNVITKKNLSTVIPSALLYNKTASITNELTSYINKVAIEGLSDVSTTELYNHRNNYNSDYWHVVINALISSNVLKSLPENVVDFGKKILHDIATGTQSLPLNEYLKVVVDKLDKRKTVSTTTEIRNNFYTGKSSINVSKFKFLEPWLRTQGNLNTNSGDTVDKILKPIINDSTCLALLIHNSSYYISIINNAGDASYEFKKSLSQSIQGTTDLATLEFAQKIGIGNDDKE